MHEVIIVIFSGCFFCFVIPRICFLSFSLELYGWWLSVSPFKFVVAIKSFSRFSLLPVRPLQSEIEIYLLFWDEGSTVVLYLTLHDLAFIMDELSDG